MKEFLNGKKTYLSVLIGLIYLAGVWAGAFEFDEKVLGAIGLTGLAFLRAGLTKAHDRPGLNLAPIAALPLIVVLLGSGCSAVAPGNDPVVVNAERTTELALETFDVYVRWEHDNRQVLSSVPQIRQSADYVRANAPTWLSTVRTLTRTYKANRTAEAKADLETALAVLRAALAEAQTYLENGMVLAKTPPLPAAP